MKKIITILIAVLVMCLVFVGCTDTNKTETDITVSVLNNETITINSKDLSDIDFTKYFIIFEGTSKIEVLESFIDTSELPVDGGMGKVKVTYKNVSATLNVNVVKETIVVSKNQDSITLDTKQINTFDFTSLFSITLNGEQVQVLESYLDKQALPILPGTGTITLNYGDETVTVEVILVEAEKEILVSCKKDTLTIWDEELSTYKFTDLFSITVDGKYVTVMKAYITLSDIVNDKATVVCSYMGKDATLELSVQKTIYEISLDNDTLEVNQTIANNYNYLSLFKATKNGEPYELSNDMVTTDVCDVLGNYTFTVTIGTTDANKVSKTLSVNVVFAHQIYVVNCFNGVQIPINELDMYDYTQLFALYVDGDAVEVTVNMIDISSLENAVAGEDYNIDLIFTMDDDTVRKSATITVVEKIDIVIIGENISVDLHSSAFDLTKLFMIKRGEEVIPVTLDMISGDVDYVHAGTYEISCTYGDIVGTATITVTDGVIINHRYSDTIFILKGTNQKAYCFADDFRVTINGLSFTYLESCIDSSNVDFSKVGEYTATLTVKYNTKALSLSSVKFDEFTSTITYIVIDTVYNISKPENVIILPQGTKQFNVLSEIKVEINNRKQALTKDPTAVSVIACYVEVLSADIDFNSPAYQEVSIAVYVYGPDKEPVIVNYNICIESDIKIKTIDRIVFEGDTVYTIDLFTITENGENVEVDYSMLNGKVNTFVPGIYKVSIEYRGMYAETQVVVCSNDLKGEYFTPLMTIPREEETDEEDQLIVEGINAKPIGDLILTENGITVNGIIATDIKFIDESTMTFNLGTNKYTLHYEDGIIVLDPDNSLKLNYNDYRRPFIYFNNSIWELKSSLVVNSSSLHVLQTTYMSYSIDLFTLTQKTSGEEKVIGLKVHLVNKTSADTVYQVNWGEASYAEGFEQSQGNLGKVIFLGDEYTFTMQTDKVAKINLKESMDRLLANKSFTGSYEGSDNAILSINNFGHYSMYVDGVLKFSVGSYELSNEVRYGGYDPTANTVLLFSYLDVDDKKPCFSLKFNLNLEEETFEIVEKTPLWGLYTMGNKYIFLDGYGKGFINYNTASNYVYKIEYQINSSVLTIKYLDTDVTFPYGDYAVFSTESFNNVLRIQDFYDSNYIGETFENKYITDGAIIRILSAVVGKNKTAADAKAEFEKNIIIITKDGELTGSAKSACFDYKLVRFSTPGFYKFVINVVVGGAELHADYVVQVLDSIYEDSPLVGSYNTSVLKSGYSLVLDKWGRAFLTTPNRSYASSYKIVGSEYFAKFSGVGYSFNLSGKLVENGLISIISNGSLLINDYVTVGVSDISANDRLSLRRITVGEVNYFFLSSNFATLGNLVEVSVISGTLDSNGSILKVISNDNETVVLVNAWGNSTNGLTVADEVYGTYTNGGLTMSLNGFGVVRLNGMQGTYKINSNKTVTVTMGDTVSFYALNFEEKTYSVSTMVIDNSIMVNKVLTATYSFSYDDSIYLATTVFQFTQEGKVIISSSASDFYEDAGIAYVPNFLSLKGENTTYLVNKNQLTITVNRYTFVFLIKDVSKPNEIVLLETNLSESEIGYFAVGQTFAN